MDKASFWEIIDGIKSRWSDEASSKELATLLRILPASTILEFHLYYESTAQALIGPEVWITASLMNGGLCGDDCLEYFRNWLIAQGHLVYQAALAKWDSLADLNLPTEGSLPVAQFEDFGVVAGRVYKEITGKYPSTKMREAPELEAWEWTDFTDEYVANNFPALWKKYGHFKREFAEDMRRANDVLDQLIRDECVIPGLGTVRRGSVISHVACGRAVVNQIFKYGDGTFAAKVECADGNETVMLSQDNCSLVENK